MELIPHKSKFRLSDLDREHAMIPGKRLGTFRRVTGKAARWILRGDQTIPRGIKTQSGFTMPQLLLQGFPDGAIRIGSTLRVLKKEGRVTYFVGSDSYFSHPETDAAGQRFAMATLLANGHVRASEVEVSGLGIAPRTLMHWTRQLDPKGPGSFYAPRPGRGGAVMTPEKMEAEPQEAGYLYVDGHVRVYHGSGTLLPRRYVSRERLCLRGPTDYGINDALGRPFFVVSKAATDGLAATLLEEIVPELLASVAAQRIGGRNGRRSVAASFRRDLRPRGLDAPFVLQALGKAHRRHHLSPGGQGPVAGKRVLGNRGAGARRRRDADETGIPVNRVVGRRRFNPGAGGSAFDPNRTPDGHHHHRPPLE